MSAHSFLLVGATFTSAIALAGDTVFILDATQGERRAQQDSVWIGKLFPGKHALMFLVSTDVWPHIAGLRYWAAVGASILVHSVTRPVVDSALARRWTSTPDLFERRRAWLRPKIDAIRSTQVRAGGSISIFPVNGASSEGVLGAYVNADGFLWASDRVQDLTAPSMYITELWQAAQRNHLSPRSTSGPHLRVVPWQTIEGLAKPL